MNIQTALLFLIVTFTRKQNPQYLLSYAEYSKFLWAFIYKLLKYVPVIQLTVNTHIYVHMKKNHGSVFLHTFSGGTKGRAMLRNKQLIDK
jgi:hypothetical protein